MHFLELLSPGNYIARITIAVITGVRLERVRNTRAIREYFYLDDW